MLDAAGQGYKGTIPLPSGQLLSMPVHFMALPFLGMPLIDNTNLEEVAQYCHSINQFEFLFVISPLHINGGTGSPVNPLAIF